MAEANKPQPAITYAEAILHPKSGRKPFTHTNVVQQISGSEKHLFFSFFEMGGERKVFSYNADNVDRIELTPSQIDTTSSLVVKN